ncbi:MAG: efflux RND transporter permease subunit [Lentisphaerae bacterium]|nr:efflux RND transporter permease subunit [Lentisphaerota bacterium]MBT7054393.1 efflux RND transporter permease subunit [Lentisphaerota bacterium]
MLLAIIFLAGALAALNMRREAFPQFSLDIITVTIPYPGADPEETEEGICRKLEDAIEGLEGVKQFNTIAREGVGSAWIEVQEDYDIAEVLDRVRSRIDAISSFPVDAEKPITAELLLRDIVLVVSLSGNMDEARLREWSQDMKDDVQQIPTVSQVEITGIRDYEIGIEVSEARLREHGLTFREVANAVRRSNLNMGGGTIRTEGEEIRVRTLGRKYTGAEFAKIVVLAKPTGELVTLDRIARIEDGFTQDPLRATVDGERAALLIIFKTAEEDALKISNAVRGFLKRKQPQLPEGAHAALLYDISAEMLRDRINLLVRNGAIGLTVVFLLLWLFLDLRLSFWAGMGMPISVAGALGLLWAGGGTINMISLFGLIMVLGIIVDDAIVVGEAIYVQRRNGAPPLRAAVDGVCEVGMPVFAAVTTTIVAFIPLAFVGGIMGKFIRILPIVVIACLLISLLECLLMLPAHLSHLPDFTDKPRRSGFFSRIGAVFHRFTSGGLEWFVEHIYAPFLMKSLSWCYVSLFAAITILLLTVGMIRGGILKFEVFNKLDGFILTSTVEFPPGTPSDRVGDALGRIEDAFKRVADRNPTLSGAPLVKYSLSLVGATLDEARKTGPHLGSAQVVLLEAEQRGVHAQDLMVAWEEEVGTIPGVESLTFSGMAAGPPGAPIEVWVQGRNMEDILAATDELKNRLRRFDGVYQIQSDFRPGKNEMRLSLKPEARGLGLTVGDLGEQMHAAFYGAEALRLQRGRDDIRVRVRYTESERRTVEALDNARIRTPSGAEVPLRSVANISFEPGYSTITRTDGLRRVSVTAEVDTKRANANEIFAQLAGGYFQELGRRFPGIYISAQGEKKKMRESLTSLQVGFPLALLGIFIIIATVFRSYLQPMVIMFTVPFGIIGACFGHLLMGYQISMLSLFGIVALSGVVVNDAIVLIEAINTNLSRGLPFFDAIRNGGVRRFRAVFLTTISTIGGLLPLILEKDMQAKFLIPMALSIAAGVAFATVLTLVLIPSLLVILNDVRRIARLIGTGTWPTREGVEPASTRGIDLLDAEG